MFLQLGTSLQVKSVFYVVFDLVFCFCKDAFDEFLHSFASATDDINQSNLYFVLITRNFNGHCSSGWENCINNAEGTSIENLTSSYGLKQSVCEPTHLFPTSSSFIDLIFTNQCNMIINLT